jgi:hypothetical protein
MKDRAIEKAIRDNANKIRANVIGYAIEVEDALTEALGYLYCPDKESYYVQWLINDIFVDLTFDKKIKLFKKFFDLSNDSFNHQKAIIKDLNEIREKRNQLAHRGIAFPWVFDEDDIDDNGYNILTQEFVNWRESCDFHKAGRGVFTFTVRELESYKILCKKTKMSIYIALHKLIDLPKDSI